MKRVLFILSLLFLVCVPQETSSKDDLLAAKLKSIRSKLQKNNQELMVIRGSLIEIREIYRIREDYKSADTMAAIISAINDIEIRLHYEIELIDLSCAIKDKHKSSYYHDRREHCKIAKQKLTSYLMYINKSFAVKDNKTALDLTGRAKDIMRSLFGLLDEYIEYIELSQQYRLEEAETKRDNKNNGL